MEQEKIIEGNKLLTEFINDVIYLNWPRHLGDTKPPTKYLKYLEFFSKEQNIKLGGEKYITYKSYNTDWNKLMEVVNKIYNTVNYSGWDFESEEYLKWEEIFDIDYTMSDFLSNNIEGIWERCIEFVKYYNTLSNESNTNS